MRSGADERYRDFSSVGASVREYPHGKPKLLKLSVELKSYIDKTNTNVLSLDVMKKAEEIEKLAKSVHDKMRGPN